MYAADETEDGKWLTHIFGLPFLPAELVEDCFVDYFMAQKPTDPALDNFADYIVENYIDENGTFPPQIWANHNGELTRTTNACESFHAKFNSNFYHSHPNLYEFVEVLIQFQVSTYVSMRSAIQNISLKKNKGSLEKQKYIQRAIDDFKVQKISMEKFVTTVSHKNKPHKLI